VVGYTHSSHNRRAHSHSHPRLPSQVPLDSRTIAEPVAIVTRLGFLFRFTYSHVSAQTAPISSVE